MSKGNFVRQDPLCNTLCPFCYSKLSKVEQIRRNMRRVCKCGKCGKVIDERMIKY